MRRNSGIWLHAFIFCYKTLKQVMKGILSKMEKTQKEGSYLETRSLTSLIASYSR